MQQLVQQWYLHLASRVVDARDLWPVITPREKWIFKTFGSSLGCEHLNHTGPRHLTLLKSGNWWSFVDRAEEKVEPRLMSTTNSTLHRYVGSSQIFSNKSAIFMDFQRLFSTRIWIFMIKEVGVGFSLDIINVASTENEVSVVREMPLPVPSICLDRPQRIKLCEGVLMNGGFQNPVVQADSFLIYCYWQAPKKRKGPGLSRIWEGLSSHIRFFRSFVLDPSLSKMFLFLPLFWSPKFIILLSCDRTTPCRS